MDLKSEFQNPTLPYSEIIALTNLGVHPAYLPVGVTIIPYQPFMVEG